MYIVSARKYRPLSFESVVGQKTLTQTLQNAIRQNHLAHAYLFCGPRGVGKTTCARIFAKTINCSHPTAEYDACNTCESCMAFNEGRSFNIHELDAASNNSVEDIRSLIEQVRVPPQIGKYSVYIIDEVHMLSSNAFNALLKTLEEPPAHAIFILATTEKHKILPTILSRCQVYDFARITVADTIAHLQYVAEKEGITVPVESLNIVAQKADGGMRDALSIFDQLVSFCGTTITYERTTEVLNVLSSDYYFRVVDLAIAHDFTNILLLFNEVLLKGFDGGHFLTGLAQHLRDVLVAKDPQTIALLETADTIRQHYVTQAQTCSPHWIFAALDILNTCSIQYGTARNKRLSVELALIRLSQLGIPNAAAATVPQQPAAQPAPQRPARQTVTQPHPAAPQSPAAKPVAAPPTVAAPPPLPTVMPHIPSAKPEVNNATPQPPTPPAQPTQNSPFTADQFNDAWAGLKELFREEPRLCSLITMYKPHLQGQESAVVELPNPWELNEMKQHLRRIHQYLHTRLHNDQLTLTLTVAQYTQNQMAFTADERYRVLLKDNAALADLKECLDLQID